MRKNTIDFALSLVGALLFALCSTVQGRAATRGISRIGYLVASSASVNASRAEAFRQGLRERGYIEGRNITIEWRYANGKLDQLPLLAADLVKLNVEVIVTAGPADTRAAKKATSRIPIVMTFDNDPVGNGFVASLARPGTNITGLSTLAPELSGKQLEILNEIIPKLQRLAVVRSSTNPGDAFAAKEIELAARASNVTLEFLDVIESRAIESAFQAARKGRTEAILVLGSAVLNSRRKQVIDLTVKHRLPAMFYTIEWVEDGGLVTYGVNRHELTRRAATYVNKILNGATPADLPVEQPTKFELVINLKTAKQIGLTIPPHVLARADKVIK
jgi:putative ABC transport system substrate-binding protein